MQKNKSNVIRKNISAKSDGGFALLVSIITTSILLLISFVIANIALKQLIIYNAYKSSQTAFYAADSGMDCAIFWDLRNQNNPAVSAFDTGSGAASNLAIGKPARQSSDSSVSNGEAPLAVDDNTDGNYFNGSVTRTSNSFSNEWWQVDLGQPASINSVNVWNRTDCCGAELSDYWVFISNTPFGDSDTPSTLSSRANTWSSHQTSQPNPSTSVFVPNVSGRYVRVQLGAQNHLSLAEVQIVGTVNSVASNGSITCNNQTVTTGSQTVATIPPRQSLIGGGGTANPTSIFQINFGNACAIVMVTKNSDGTTKIDSHGYNTCDTSSIRRYERGITTTY